MNRQSKEYRQKNRIKINQDSKSYTQKLKRTVLSYYGVNGMAQCHCCGETRMEFLTLDHINGNGNQHRQQIKFRFYNWIIRNNFPFGFRTLCHNCNFSLGAFGYCPHGNVMVGEKNNMIDENLPLFAELLSQQVSG